MSLRRAADAGKKTDKQLPIPCLGASWSERKAEFSADHDATLRGWWNYYGSFYPSAMSGVFRHFDLTLAFWARRKYKRLARHKRRSRQWLARVARLEPHWFVHWRSWYAKDRTLGAV